MEIPTERRYLWLFAILAVVGLVADQATKYVVFAKVYPEETHPYAKVSVIPGLFDLRTSYSFEEDAGDQLSFLRTLSGTRIPYVNRGALFGIGNGDGESAGMNKFFAGVSIMAACFIVFWTTRTNVAKDPYLCLALGLILGGTFGNLYDRIVFSGVRDFLHCHYETHVWPDFNVADCCLVCGAGVLLVHSFFVTDPVPTTEPAKTEPVALSAPMQTASPTTGA